MRTKPGVLVPPCSYQGGKRKWAGKILDIMDPVPGEPFYDLCCGAGSVSVELVRRGHPPEDITMVDLGPWGQVWELIGNGTFDLDLFQDYIREIPENLHHIHDHILELAAGDPSVDTPYVFLLLQAASVGGRAIWIKDGKWISEGVFGHYNHPKEGSKNYTYPMVPLPKTLLKRVELLLERMRGMTGMQMAIEDLTIPEGPGLIYIDPPYLDTLWYGHVVSEEVLTQFPLPTYVSEKRPLSEDAYNLGSPNVGMAAIWNPKKLGRQEWLSRVR